MINQKGPPPCPDPRVYAGMYATCIHAKTLQGYAKAYARQEKADDHNGKSVFNTYFTL